MIPKLIHHIWTGDERPGDLLEQCRDSFRRHHGSWRFRHWCDPDLDRIQWPTDPPGVRVPYCNAERLAILYDHGGWFVDHDLWCVRPLDDLCGGNWVCGEMVNPVVGGWTICDGIIGVEPGEPLILAALEATLKRLNPGGNMQEFGQAVVRSRCRPQPWRVFYPHHMREPEHRYRCFPETRTVHLWLKHLDYDLARLRRMGA